MIADSIIWSGDFIKGNSNWINHTPCCQAEPMAIWFFWLLLL